MQSQRDGVCTVADGCSNLYAGCEYVGYQNNPKEAKRYNVKVTFREVDLANSYVCGDLWIEGLTAKVPEMTTFFEGEIIGPKHRFVTDKWKANKFVDETHWNKFDKAMKQEYLQPDYVHDFASSDYIFMRWKELFLVDDPKQERVEGCSFDGFYYICFDRTTSRIEGYYYHSALQWYQYLLLNLKQEDALAACQWS